MTPTLIAACTGATMALATAAAPHLTFAMDAYAITTPQRQAAFLANVGHESTRLSVAVEGLNYKASALISGFGRHRISIEDATRYGRIDGLHKADQEGVANCLYGGPWGLKNLGNSQPGDGWKFRGQGWMQSTGRSNARALTKRLRAKFPALAVPDFEVTPELLQQPQWAALSAADYIDMCGANAFADAGNFDAYCDKINLGRVTAALGDSKGWADRLELYRDGKKALGIA